MWQSKITNKLRLQPALRAADAIGALHINRYYAHLLATSPVIRTNGAMQIVASHFSFHEIATMLRRWWARPLRSVFSNATRLILPLLAVIRTKCDGLQVFSYRPLFFCICVNDCKTPHNMLKLYQRQI